MPRKYRDKSPRPHTKCVRSKGCANGEHRYCGETYASHLGEEKFCPDGTGTIFRRHRSDGSRAAHSFSDRESECLDVMVRGLLGGTLNGDEARRFTRKWSAQLGSIARKAAAMRASVRRRAEENAAAEGGGEVERVSGVVPALAAAE